MKVMITGSRALAGNDDAERDVRATLDALLVKNVDLTLLSGGARGVDTLGERWAEERGVSVTQFKPNYKRYRRGAPLVRNIEMLAACDGVVAFWDGTSRGTKHVLDHAKDKLLSCITYTRRTSKSAN